MIRLRCAKADDLNDYLRIRNSYFVMKYNCMSSLTKEEAVCNLERAIHNKYCYFIDFHGKMIGVIYFSEDQMRFGVNALTISYFLDEQYARKGYMSQAIKMALAIVFDEGVEVISARVFSENIASINLLKRIGFKQEGYLHHAVLGYGNIVYDDTLWAITKNDLR